MGMGGSCGLGEVCQGELAQYMPVRRVIRRRGERNFARFQVDLWQSGETLNELQLIERIDFHGL